MLSFTRGMSAWTSLLCLSLLWGALAFPHANSQKQVMAFHEINSFKPILHIHYDHHFKESPQFADLEVVLNELYSTFQDYLEILYTDCEQDKQLSLYSCEAMSKTKDNRHITGTSPSSNFKSLGRKIIQSPPASRIFDQSKDVYSLERLQQFVHELMPNFFKVLNSREEYEEFLLPHYVPKLILIARQEEDVPLVLKKLAVNYYLRFDMAIVTDLNDELLPLFEAKRFPHLVVLKYDFEEQSYKSVAYPSYNFGEDSYYDIKEFLERYALQEPRNDLVFHKIFMETSPVINTAETSGQLEELKEKVHGWSIIGRSPDSVPARLYELKEKYDRYFSYIHYKTEAPSDKQFQIFYPEHSRSYPFDNDIQFNALGVEDFKTNLTVWLRKDFVVLGVRKAYSHVCGIVEKPMFVDACRCLIIADSDASQLEKDMKIEFKEGFIVRLKRDPKTRTTENTGVNLDSSQYGNVYRELDYATRMQIKEILDEFIEHPLRQVDVEESIERACFHPTKKCFLLFVNLAKKDRTLQTYTKQIAINYINSFVFFQVDIESNAELAETLGVGKKADIVVFNPRSQQYTRLGRKVTKGLIDQFLKANKKNDKRLKKIKLEGVDTLTIRRRESTQQPIQREESEL